MDVYIQGYGDIPRQTYRIPLAPLQTARFPVRSAIPHIPRQSMYFTKQDLRTRIMYHAEEVCRFEVSRGYVSDQITPATILLVLFESLPGHSMAENTRGFILGQFTEDKGMYLDVVCSTKYGLSLIDYFVILARQFGMSYIKLNSLPKVLSLYPRYGFQHRKSCTVPADVEMSPQMASKWKEFHSFSPDDFYMHPDSLNYMFLLHQQGYSADKRSECQNPPKTVESFLLHRCAADGFQMRLCLEPEVAEAVVAAPPEPSSRQRPRSRSRSRERRRSPARLPRTYKAHGTRRSLRMTLRSPEPKGKSKKELASIAAKKKTATRRSTRLQTQKDKKGSSGSRNKRLLTPRSLLGRTQ